MSTNAGPSTSDANAAQRQGAKRKIELIDPDTKEELPDAKKRNIELDEGTKEKCLLTLINAYNSIEALIDINIQEACRCEIAGPFTCHNEHDFYDSQHKEG